MSTIQKAPVNYYVFPGLKGVSLSHLISKECQAERANKILRIIADYYKITVEKILSGDRKRIYCEARMIFNHICFYNIGLNKSQLAGILHRDHTSIIHSLNTLEDLMFTEDRYQREVNLLSSQLYS